MHNPTPWRITEPGEKKGPREIVDAKGCTVAKLTPLDMENAEFIVQAANTRAALEEAWSEYERRGAVCTLEGQPLVYAGILEELKDIS